MTSLLLHIIVTPPLRPNTLRPWPNSQFGAAVIEARMSCYRVVVLVLMVVLLLNGKSMI